MVFKGPNDERFPIFEFFILSMAVFSSAISLSGLFPYVPFMVIWLGLAKTEDEAGYSSGLLASAMMFGRLLSSIVWGQIADKYGRKPCILCGCIAIFFFSLMFGMSNTFVMALLARFGLGFFNPIWGVAKTLVSELCTKKQEARGMALTTGCWSIGLIFGPSVGGLLANPCELYPSVFGGSDLLNNYPYLLPNIVTAAISGLGATLVYLYFPETLFNKERKEGEEMITINDDANRVKEDKEASAHSPPFSQGRDSKVADGSSEKPEDIENDKVEEEELRFGASVMELLSVPGVMPALIAYFLLSFCSICFDEVVPLWAMATAKHGGLALPQQDIGKLMTLAGCGLTFYTFVIYPPLANYLGKTIGFKVGMLFSSPCFVFITLLSGMNEDSPYRWPLLVIIYTLAKSGCSLCFSSLALVLNSCVEKEARASLNGLSMCCGSIAKAIGPFSASILFAWSLNNGLAFPLDFHILFLIVGFSSVFAAFVTLPSDDHIPISMSLMISQSIELSSTKNKNDGTNNPLHQQQEKSINNNIEMLPSFLQKRSEQQKYSQLKSEDEEDVEYGLDNDE